MCVTLLINDESLAIDLVQKYKERIESDTRQIKQLDIERNEAELAKSKFQVRNQLCQE